MPGGVDGGAVLRVRQPKLGTRKLHHALRQPLREAGSRPGAMRCSTSCAAPSGAPYLSLVTDAYSRKIVGYHVAENLQIEGVRRALERALRSRRSNQPLVHHSDRGIQYCSTYYQRLHARHGIRCSMTDGYDCYQNALAERVNGILKGELLLHRPPPTLPKPGSWSSSLSRYTTPSAHICPYNAKHPMKFIGCSVRSIATDTGP